jgi:ribose transport system permease protein
METRQATRDRVAPTTDAESARSPSVDDGGRTATRRAARPERWALLLAWLVVVVIFGLLRSSTYLTTGNVQTIFGSQAVLLVLTLGLLFPLTTGDFDLSIASNLSLTAMLIAVLNAQHGWSIVPAVLVGLASATLVGVINGGLVVLIGIDSFIVTLGTGTVLLGLVQWISHSNDITGVSPHLTAWTIGHHLAGISVMFFYGVIATLAIFYVYEYTPLGRRLLFVGKGRSVSRLSGLRVTRIRWGSFVVGALFAGFAGVLYAGSLAGADPASGQSFLLPAYAAAFLGATAIAPGRFNPLGTFIAVYFLVSGITGLQLLGLQEYVQQLFYGGALVTAVALSELARRRSRSRTAGRAQS